MGYLLICVNDWEVRIAIDKENKDYLTGIYEELTDEETRWNFDSFELNDKLWYDDGSQYLLCTYKNYEDQVIVFE